MRRIPPDSMAFLFLLAFLATACSSSVPGPNRPPVAAAGSDASAAMGETVTLDGSRSWDPDGDALAFSWELLSAPAGAIAGGVLAPQDQAQCTFTPTAPGPWLVGLRVTDGALESARDVVQVRVFEPCATDADCDDDVYCNGPERCLPAGAGLRCGPGEPVDCSGLDASCRRGQCVELSRRCEAALEPAGTACEDGLWCTELDACDGAGLCTGPARVCVPGAACRTATCDEAQDRCAEAPAADGAGCDDGLFCTLDDACQGGSCQGAPRDCNAPGSCASGACDEAQDRCTGAQRPDGTPCDDGQRCTAGDQCQSGACLGLAVDCSGLDSLCAQGVCDPGDGLCHPTPLHEGEVCEDALFCTAGERCASGVCQPQGVTDCSALADACHAGACVEAERRCVALPAREGEFCDDGLWCTLADRCVEGACLPVLPRACPGGEDCQGGFCDEDLDACGFRPAEDGAPCEDGDPCTQGDTCLDAACVPGPGCELGCDPEAEPPRCLEVALSNVEPGWLCEPGAPDFPALGDGEEIDTDDGLLGGFPHPFFHVAVQPGGDPTWPPPQIGVFVFQRVDIPAGVTLRVVGNRALAIVACEDLLLDGVLDASAADWPPGAGGWEGGAGSRLDNGNRTQAEDGYGPGGGGRGLYQASDPWLQSGGGGGAHGRQGGDGGDGEQPGETTRQGGEGGGAFGEIGLIPLQGGAGSYTNGGDGGGGGGAVQLGAGGRIEIGPQGGVRAAGAGGEVSQEYNYGAGGGGGAGGGILLEAREVSVAGTLAANGGGGGGGRADYYYDGDFCPADTPTAGLAGDFGDATADGGAGCTPNPSLEGGDGGRGGARSGGTQAGVAGGNGIGGGGGGGGVGRIRLNTLRDGQLEVTGTTSPDCTTAGSACTRGELGLR